jgi:hypothetical protein
MDTGAIADRGARNAPVGVVPSGVGERQGEQCGPLFVVQREHVGEHRGDRAGRSPLPGFQAQQVLVTNASKPRGLPQTEPGPHPSRGEQLPQPGRRCAPDPYLRQRVSRPTARTR